MTGTSGMYISSSSNASDPWEIVKGALADQGVANPCPAPAASLSFVPRHLRAAAGSDTAQRDLQALAGWSRPTRRGVLAGILAVASVPAAAALPTVESTPYSAQQSGVSLRMSAVISNALRLSAIDTEPDTPEADAASNAVTALVNENPGTLTDLAAKLSAIAMVMTDDCGTYVLQRLAGDATALVGSVAK